MQTEDGFYTALGLVQPLMLAETEHIEHRMIVAYLRLLRQAEPKEQDATRLLDAVFIPCLPFRIITWPQKNKGAGDSAPEITPAKAAERLFMWMFVAKGPHGCLSFLDTVGGTPIEEELCQDKESLFSMLAAALLDRVLASGKLPLLSLYRIVGKSVWARLCQACKEPTTRGRQVVIVCLWRWLRALWHKRDQKISSYGKWLAFSLHAESVFIVFVMVRRRRAGGTSGLRYC
jgi:hypothetical protein